MDEEEKEWEKLLYVDLPNLINKILHLSSIPLPVDEDVLKAEIKEIKRITNAEYKSILELLKTPPENYT